ncbi:hypothetical protein [Seonamhaeicola marinus]|uniref:Uncharacterized protein n=1 Tax=Seonamhaeicola marinus TaxID=1912246 RepID=A0A5D0HYC4_9FLAO|nr:hypothetical protein [Seonamhaeicola marinus]TYA74462.1 hypothetical protein FUA24_14150 [Seonamhaeicola marinus]
MKVASTIVIILASVMAIFNLTKIDYAAPFEKHSITAVITVLASLCAILLMLILKVSRRIDQKVKNRK